MAGDRDNTREGRAADKAQLAALAAELKRSNQEAAEAVKRALASVTRTKLFVSNRSQPVRLTKDAAFPETVKEVVIVPGGMRRTIVPTNAAWDDFFDAPGIDLPNREQPARQDREA